MGICGFSETDTKKKKPNQLLITKTTIRQFRKNYYQNQLNNSKM